ncbi:hypothetical protein AB0M87_14910 [Streptomyces sp. NPDC051320]|uniref:Rv1733c family protein n=1 Tax=Streptomyces sp. NPDC051320 TaxID=3154644 RepID=UPI00342EF3AE
MTLLLLLLFLSMAPLMALMTSSAIEHAAARQRSEVHHVTAVLQRTAPVSAPAAQSQDQPTVQTPVRWTAPDGTPHTATALVRPGQHAGTATHVWVTDQDRIVPGPPSPAQTVFAAALTAANAVLGTGLLLLLLWAIVRSRFDAHRMAQWEREWADNGPRWSHGRR